MSTAGGQHIITVIITVIIEFTIPILLTMPPPTPLDVSAFPHIFDLIISSAPRTSLHRLRLTSQALKARVDSHLLDHVLLYDLPFGYGQRTGDKILSLEGHRLPLLWQPTSPLGIGVLDISTSIDYCSSGALQHPEELGQIDVVRTCARGNGFREIEVPNLGNLRANSHVHFASISHRSDEITIPRSIRKLVLNLQYTRDTSTWHRDVFKIRPYRYRIVSHQIIDEFVVILDRREIGEPPREVYDSQLHDVALLSSVVDVACFLSVGRCLRRLVIVGAPRSEEMDLRLLHLGSSDLFSSPPSTEEWRKAFGKRVMEQLELWREHFVEYPAAGEDITADEAPFVIEFVDREAYRVRVGERAYASEVDRSAFDRCVRGSSERRRGGRAM